VELSIAAKAYYVLNKLNAKATMEDIAEMISKFGWTVSDSQLERATEFLEKARLITKS
jgi:predicted AAA+ superfamily ATPase